MGRAAFPIVHNFRKDTYGADTQNWDMAQDKFGRMIFANKRGLLIFNGEEWSLHYPDNAGAIRAVEYDPATLRIYAGCSDTFGYFEPDSITGKLHYRSISSLIKNKSREVGEIWKVYKLGADWWFQGEHSLYRFDGRRVEEKKIPSRVATSAVVDNTLYIATHDGRILRYSAGRFIPLPGSDILSGHLIRAIVPHPLDPHKILIVSAINGCYTADLNGITPFPTEFDSFLREAQVFCAATKGRVLILGTVNSGALIKDFNSGQTTYLNKETGLQNNTVLSAGTDINDNIWLGLDNGIDFALYSSPVKLLLPPNFSCGTGYASVRLGSNLILGTNQGLYTLPYPAGNITQPQRLLRGQVWDISKSGTDLIVCSDYGLFTGSPTSLKKIEGISGAWCARPVAASGDTLLVASYDGFHLIAKPPQGEWRQLGIVGGFNESPGKFSIDGEGKIWIANWKKGLYKLTLDLPSRRFRSIRHFSEANGLPSSLNTGVTFIGDRTLISTQGGFCILPAGSNSVRRSAKADSIFRGNGSFHIYTAPDSALWAISPEKIIRARRKGNHIYVDSATFNPAHTDIVPGFDHISFFGDTAILAGQSGFFEMLPPRKPLQPRKASLFLAKIYLDKDSLVQEPENGISASIPELPHNAPSITFVAASPEYRRQGAVKYSFYLEGYDKGWSPYSRSNSKEYTRLGYGDYTLHIRAADGYDNSTAETSYQFSVKTPWYFSLPARIVYALLIVMALVAIGTLISRFANRSARIIEARKEKEIEMLQSRHAEQEITHRSESLSKAAKQTVQKNEILIRISSQLDKIKSKADGENGGKSISDNLDSVQEIIRRSLNRGGDLNEITRDFDGVYGDYVERLTALYPSLTKSEVRLSCYIKMGLCTKEIAPLLNVAPKSVEMSRYRLRKKLNLDRSVNLTEYLQRF